MLSTLLVLLHVDAGSSSSAVRLSGHVPSRAIAKSVFLKQLDAATHVPVTFVLPLRNQEVLEELVQRMYDPNDHEHYGKYLSSEEFIEQFAPTQEDYDKVIAYAKSLGLTVTGQHANRVLLNVVGFSRSVESAFNLKLHQHQKANGQKFHAPNNNPEVQSDIAGIIHSIVGLDNHSVWHTYHRRREPTKAVKASLDSNSSFQSFPSGPGGGFAPGDLLTAYNLTGIKSTGAGQAIALFELASYQASDINEYASYFGLPTPNLKNVLVDGGSRSGIDAEVTLDIELALALAPQSQILVYEGPNSNQGVLDTYNKIATDNLAKQVSTSWGLGEDNESTQYLQSESAIFMQMAAQGQTMYAAAGDSGAYDDYAENSSTTLIVDDPASQPYVTGVGGTTLTVNPSTGAYQSEHVWNDGLGNGAGGGGVSQVWPIPSWQTNVPTLYSRTNRNVPDVALNADSSTGYAIYYDGQWQIYGGTSCAAPLWAAFTALVNQQLATNQQPVIGFANPKLYTIGTGSVYKSDFHDITVGDNLFYRAGVGYDNATGWGSFNAGNLFSSLTDSSVTPPIQHNPVLHIAMTQNGAFVRGKTASYQIAVSNQGAGATSGAVNVTITLPSSLTYTSFSGAGWTFNKKTLTFTQSKTLAPGSSYPPITLTVSVNEPSSVTSTATVSGGGSSSSSSSNLTNLQ